MNEWQIFLTVMILYWSDVITGPILYVKREVGHWFDMRSIKKETQALKEARKKGMTTDELIEEGLLHEVKFDRGPYVEPTKLEEAWWWICRALWYNLMEHPEDLRYWLIHKYQRAKRGWSTRDTWGYHHFLATVIIGGLEHLKKTKHGVPFEVPNDDENMTKAVAKWDKILDTIILTFKTSQIMGEHYWFYQNSEKYDVKEANKHIKIQTELKKENPDLYNKNELYVMTKEECKAYEKGWKLFQEHFFGLND